MPITKSAKKALRAGLRKRAINLKIKKKLKEAISGFKKKPSEKLLAIAKSNLDKAAKKNIIAKNKASRLKSKLAIYLKNKPSVQKTTKSVKSSKKQ